MKTTFRILLACAIVFLAYICVDSVVTPIEFEETRVQREEAVVKNLIHIRTAEVEFKNQNGRFIADADSLLLFLKTAPKKEVLKEGSLTDKQLEAGMTEHKAVKIIDKAKAKAMSKLKTDDQEAIYEYIWANDKDICLSPTPTTSASRLRSTTTTRPRKVFTCRCSRHARRSRPIWLTRTSRNSSTLSTRSRNSSTIPD